MKLVKSILVTMLLGIIAIQVAWAETQEELEIKQRQKLMEYYTKAKESGDLEGMKNVLQKVLGRNVEIEDLQEVLGGQEVNPEIQDETNLLIDAAEHGNLDEVKLRLSKGADINGKGGRGKDTFSFRKEYTALIQAVSGGYFDIVKYLVEKGADVNANYGYTALMEATKCSNRLLMSFGREHLDVYECKRDDKKCLKEKYSTCLKMVKYLVKNGADMNIQNKNGETALMIASNGGKLEIVKYLISKGADINATDKDGKNALMHHLGYSESLDIVKALVGDKGGFLSLFKKSNGVDVNAKDSDGKTALMYARSLEAIKYLLSKGADINAKDNKGKSVFDYTKSGEIAEFLLSKGAKR